MKNWWYFLPLLYICLLCDEVLLPWNFRSHGFDVIDPSQIWKKVYFFHILGLSFKISYQIASLFDMFIDMGERIAGKQDRLTLIIEHLLRASQIAKNIHFCFTFWPIYEKLVLNLFPLVVYMSPLWWGLHLLTFRCPCYPWILWPTWPEKNNKKNNLFHIFYFNS